MNNRPQKAETYKCDICEQEFENEEDLKEHAEDCACSETEYKKQDAGDNEGESEEENEELPPLTGEESSDDADEDVQEKDNRRSKQERKR